jgi:hypothetical protein
MPAWRIISMSNDSLPAKTEHVRLAVPELATRPFQGGGCCVVAAADLVCDALGGLRGLRAVACDEEHGEIRLELDADADAGLLPTVRAILDEIGYPVAEVRT